MTPGLRRAAARAGPSPSAGGALGLRRPSAGYALLALLCYVPPLLTDTGKVAADTKTYLYLDPARLMSRAVSMWDPHVGMGTVTHQNLGYLFPMGPFYWALERLGLPDWVAQRLWLGSLLFGAATGVLYLCRTLGLRGAGVVVAALAYTFGPYSLHYAARISVILLPWAGLGWMIGLTIKALRVGGWRYPALFALLVQVVGSVNATALVFAGVGPVLWVLYALFVARDHSWRHTVAVTLRIALLTVLCSLWWMAGLSLQSGYGLNVLRYTETVRAVARTSLANEVLRGLGYWFFYGQDRLGPWIEASRNYTQRPAIIVIGYGLVCLALLAAASIRWRHRPFFVVLALVGVVVAVGAHPYDSPTPLGALFKTFATSSTAGMALRSTGRAIPLVTLGLALLLGRGVDAAARVLRRRGRRGLASAASVAVGALVLANFPALYDGTFYGAELERSEELPAYWLEAASYVDGQSHDTRVLELPGSDFASYRWGNTVDPITPGLIDRPYVARELIPYGTPPSADLLNAFDRRLQELVYDPAGFADLLRRMSVGDVLLRYDIQHERYNLIRPRLLQRAFTPDPPGLEGPTAFGTEAAGEPLLNYYDDLDLGSPAGEPPNPPLAAYKVTDPLPIVRAESAKRPLILAGDGEGLVDVSDVGLLAGAGVVLYAASFAGDPDGLVAALADDAVLVVTDSNRRRARRWSTVRDNTGYTEQAGEEPIAELTGDARLPLFPGAGDDSYTVTEQRGVRSVAATDYGNPIALTPEDRAAVALDGDVRTAWRTSAFDEAIGQRIEIDFGDAVTTNRVNLVQPLYGPRERYITEVELRFDGGDAQRVVLGAGSRTRGGQTVFFDRRTFRTLEIEVTDLNVGRRLLHRGASAVGFAEIRIRPDGARDDVRVEEVVVMPRDLLAAVGDDSADHPLVLVMNRLRGLPVPPRSDEEAALARSFTLPNGRSFSLTGTARVTTIDDDLEDLDDALGVAGHEEGGVTERASHFLPGCVRCRPLAAIDGDPTTAWRTPFEAVRNEWVEYTLPVPVTFDHLDLEVVADGRHSVPTGIRLQVDGATREFVLEPIDDRLDAGDNATRAVRLEFPAMTGRRITVTVVDVRETTTRSFFHTEDVLMPAAIAELGIPGVRAPATPAAVPDRCRDDLLTLDGAPLPIRVVGGQEEASSLQALTVEPCDPDDPDAVPTLRLAAGEHVLRSRPGSDISIDIDRLVLASAAGGGPLQVSDGRVTGLPARAPAAPSAEVLETGDTRLRVRVSGVAGPFWLVLGESHSSGWVARVDGGDDPASQLVDGYANGWRIDPGGRATVEVTLEWVPQRRVWIALGFSVAGVLLCALIVVVTWRRRRLAPAAAAAEGDVELVGPAHPLGDATPGFALWAGPLLGGLAAALIVAPWVGVLVAGLVFAALRWPPSRVVLALGSPAVLGLAALYITFKQLRYRFPPIFEWPTLFPRARTLGWLAIVLLAADALVELLRTRRRRSGQVDGGSPDVPRAPGATGR